MSAKEHQQASDPMPLFCAKEVHRALEHWGLGEEMLLGKASAEVSHSRLIENHSRRVQAFSQNRRCTNLKKSSVPTGQCAELNNTNRGGSYKSKAEVSSSASVSPSTQLQISSGESVLSSRFLGGEHWLLKVLSETTSCNTGAVSYTHLTLPTKA